MSVDGDMAAGRVPSVVCARCRRVVPAGAHIVTSPFGPTEHRMYCPDHCPCRKRRVQ